MKQIGIKAGFGLPDLLFFMLGKHHRFVFFRRVTTGSTRLRTVLLNVGNHQGGGCSPGSSGVWGFLQKSLSAAGKDGGSLANCFAAEADHQFKGLSQGEDAMVRTGPFLLFLCCAVMFPGKLPLWKKCSKESQGCRPKQPVWQENQQQCRLYTQEMHRKMG